MAAERHGEVNFVDVKAKSFRTKNMKLMCGIHFSVVSCCFSTKCRRNPTVNVVPGNGSRCKSQI